MKAYLGLVSVSAIMVLVVMIIAGRPFAPSIFGVSLAVMVAIIVGAIAKWTSRRQLRHLQRKLKDWEDGRPFARKPNRDELQWMEEIQAKGKSSPR